MKKLASTLTMSALLCALGGESMAQEEAAGAERKWYGAQTLLADALSGSLLAIGAATAKEPIAYVGLASYLVTPAVIHGFHEHKLRIGLSLGMRVLFPIMGGLLGYGLAGCDQSRHDGDDSPDWCGFVPGMVGIGMGALAASIVDASIAWDTPTPVQPVPPPASIKQSAVSFTTASIVPTSNGPRLMIGGRF
jgi:hypothetical protein